MTALIGPFKVDPDTMEIHDPETGGAWTLQQEGKRWRYRQGTAGRWSPYYTKAEAIERCNWAALKARALPGGATLEPADPLPPLPGGPPTAADMEHFAKLRLLGCAVEDEHCSGALEIHHVRKVPGQRRRHDQTICLCAGHHRTGGPGVAFHAGQVTWQERYGPIGELLAQATFSVGELAAMEAGA